MAEWLQGTYDIVKKYKKNYNISDFLIMALYTLCQVQKNEEGRNFCKISFPGIGNFIGFDVTELMSDIAKDYCKYSSGAEEPELLIGDNTFTTQVGIFIGLTNKDSHLEESVLDALYRHHFYLWGVMGTDSAISQNVFPDVQYSDLTQNSSSPSSSSSSSSPSSFSEMDKMDKILEYFDLVTFPSDADRKGKSGEK